MDTATLVSFFAALFAIVNPIGNLPIFISATSDMHPGARRWVVAMITLFVAAALVVFLWSGQLILEFFGISMPAFRIAGGILLLGMGLRMVRGEERVKVTQQSDDGLTDFIAAEKRFKDVMVPLGVPLFVGPGSMSTVILFASEARQHVHAWMQLLGMSVVVVIVSAAMGVVLSLAGPIDRVMGKTALSIATRILGLIICAIAVQFMLNGLSEVMPGAFDATRLDPKHSD